MNKFLYFLSLTVLWIGIISLFAILLIIASVIPIDFGFSYALGRGMATPQIWLISIGITLLCRPIIYKFLYKETKHFSKKGATICIILGLIWCVLNIGSKLVSHVVEKELIENYNAEITNDIPVQPFEREFTENELDEIENQFTKFCTQINKQLPIQIDKRTKWNAAVYTCWNLVYTYTIDIDINDFDKSYLDNFLNDIKLYQKEMIPQMLKNNYGLTNSNIKSLCKTTGLTFRFSYFDKNNQMIGVIIFDYDDF